MRPVRIGAHPVVQIEQHRGALRRRLEQIAELAEDVRTNRVALVLGEQESGGPLARVDVEVVEPEIAEHFLELSLAVGRTQNLLLRELDDHHVGALLLRVRLLPRLCGSVAILHLLLPIAPRLEHGQLVLLRDRPRAEADRLHGAHRFLRSLELTARMATDTNLSWIRSDAADVAGGAAAEAATGGAR